MRVDIKELDSLQNKYVAVVKQDLLQNKSIIVGKNINVLDLTSPAARDQFNGLFSGLSVTVSGAKPVTVRIVEPDCAMVIQVEGTRIALKSPRCTK